jgi:glycosyltransferase involved in cell wall biosynthesis
LKILQINASYKPAYIYGGPTMSVSKLSEQIVKAGHSLHVFTTTANGKAELPVVLNTTIDVDGVSVTYFKRITKDHSHFSPALLARLWHEVKQCDIVHIHAWWNLVSVLSCFIAVVKGVKVVVSPRGTLSAYSFNYRNSFSKKLLHQLIGKKLLDQSFIHATSPNEQKALSELIKPVQFFDIPNFVQLPPYEEVNIPLEPNCLKLLFLSRIDEKKGLDILLNALSAITISYRLTIVGDGNEQYINGLKQLAEQKGISENLTWLGFQHSNKFELYKQHDLFILPSHDENFGNVVIESLSMGTAVLISTHVGLADYVSTNNLGWVFNLDELSLKNTINEAARQPDKLMQIRNDAPLQVRADFNEEKLTQQYIAMYDQILNHGHV